VLVFAEVVLDVVAVAEAFAVVDDADDAFAPLTDVAWPLAA
jgi:hypothetical protein